MADERNESPSQEPRTASDTEAVSPQEPAAPRRRGRKPKAEAADAAPAAGDAPAKPARRTRAKRAAAESADSSDAVSAEVAQARMLAQISQAQVARQQRKEADAAAELVAAADAPAPKTRKRKTAAKPAAAESPVETPKSDDAQPGIEIPFVDPALRPHRRGRKPKAYVEAERAAAAALEAQRQLMEEAAKKGATGDGSAHPSSDSRVSEDAEGASKAPRAARGRRSRKDAKDGAETQADAQGTADVKVRDADEKGASEDAKSHKQAATEDQARAEGGAKERRTHASRHGDRGGRSQNQDRGDRRGNNRAERGGRGGKRNNRYANAPTEPSLSREELASYKVAELREKAHELDLDTTGKKKAELVEEVYAAAARAEGFRDIEGILEITNEGFGYIRAHGYMPSKDDAFVPVNLIRAARLRTGDYIVGTLRPSRANDKFPGLAKIASVNGVDPEQIRLRPKFAELTPIYPNERLRMEHGRDSITGRAIDIVSPIGKGQRGLIVSPPKAGKTTVLKHICQSIAVNNPEVHLICLLVDERPEEVTDMERSIHGEVVASTFDMPADNHTRVSELVIERAKRIVEMGGDVVVVLDSITRLARAYNLAAPASGRILSGGVDSAALYPPKRFLGAARNIENGGSLTILASALIDTGSKMDEVIFEEFKGTGNMELKLDRDLADRRIFPAIDPVASGTRNEDLLVDENMRPFVWGIRRILANMNNTERAAASFIKGLKGTNSNEEFLIRTAKKAADHPEAL